MFASQLFASHICITFVLPCNVCIIFASQLCLHYIYFAIYFSVSQPTEQFESEGVCVEVETGGAKSEPVEPDVSHGYVLLLYFIVFYLIIFFTIVYLQRNVCIIV